MKWFAGKKEDFEIVLRKYFSTENNQYSLNVLREVINSVRGEDFTLVLNFLKANPEITNNLSRYIHQVFQKKTFNLLLTESDILSENAFIPELKKKIIDTVLPKVYPENTVSNVISNVLVIPSRDLKYAKSIPDEEFDEFLRLINATDFITDPLVKKELLLAFSILALRVIGNALDVELLRMVPEYRNFDNPFLALQDEMEVLNTEFRKTKNIELNSKDERYKQIKIYLKQGLEFVNKAFKNSSKYGISSKVNQSLIKMRQQLVRMQEIIDLLVIDKESDIIKNSKKLIINVLRYKSNKNDLIQFMHEGTRLKSHLITNHTAATGSNYITSTAKGYYKMFGKACGAGFIVGILCVLKMFYSYIPGSEFFHAFMYALNYAMGFIAIYLLHYSLATKQPAMTAATMAKVLSEGKNTSKNYQAFALVVSNLFRTQFIAFVGNVLIAFPVSLLIIYGLDQLTGVNYAAKKSATLLRDLNPFESKAILHACIAGFFLFISGIISGSVGNSLVYYEIPNRIQNSPLINQVFGSKFTTKFANFYARNWAGIISNLWFGVFLGVTGPIGTFLGLDIDIRHITFAAGNFALGLYGVNFQESVYTFWICFVTVFLIGFFNFIVSFGLSAVLAFRSRKIDFSEFVALSKVIFQSFMRNPFRFFLPLRSNLDAEANEILQETVSKK